MQNVKAVILAGGKSSRMGHNKALISLNGKPIAQYIVDTLQQIFPQVYISGEAFTAPTIVRNIPDSDPDKGPMGGICASLTYLKEDAFFAPCDMPFLSKGIVKEVLAKSVKGTLSVVRCAGKVYPTVGVYPYVVLPALQQALAANKLKMVAFLSENQVHYINLPEHYAPFLQNINTPEALTQAQQFIEKELNH